MNNNKHPYSNRKYDIVSYDPNWVHQFEELKIKIQEVFGNVRIEHIGSTAVPDMSGKSCIDILVVVNDLQVVEDHISDMGKLGFLYAGEFVMKDSRLFRIMKDDTLLANIHFFLIGHPHNTEMLAMRDYLRSRPDEAMAYSTIKQELQVKYPDDYASYRKEKDEYMNKLKECVKEWALKNRPIIS